MIEWHLRCHDRLASTSDLCREEAENGAREGLAILARRQTAGRGTRGRSWVDPGGNLSFSFLIRPGDIDRLVGVLPFMIAVATFDSLAYYLPSRDRLSLKWPNDLMLDRRKLGGILIERGGDAPSWVVVGIGINLSIAPVMAGRVLACLSEAGASPEPEEVAERILAEFSRRAEEWRTLGFGILRKAWLARAHLPGERLAVQRGDDYISGSFAGLDEYGRLLLRTDRDTVLSFVAGDVLLLG